MSQDKSTNDVCTDDVCEACGSFVELGSVIAEDDTVLVLPFVGKDKEAVNALSQKYIDAAKGRFETVQVSTQESTSGDDVTLQVTLNFDCTAEKLIFEMGLSAI
ncbi:MAG: YfcZ/YiiS family protein [Psychromonas sp.]